MSKKKPGEKKRGIALLMVIMVLVMMVLMAICFAVSMRTEKRLTRSESRRSKARLGALGAYNYSVARLTRTCEMREIHAKQQAPYNTPEYDSVREYQVSIDLPGLNVNDPRGEIWSAQIVDEQGKIDINSATPWLLGNLLGSAIITQTALPDDTVILVDSTRNFPSRGSLWVNGELIEYGNIARDRFLDCRRGCYRSSPRFSAPRTLGAGKLAIDARAYRVCQYRVRSRPGKFTPFRTVEEIRRIADQGAYVIDRSLFNRIEPMITVHSGRNSGWGWIYSQKIQSNLPGIEPDSPDTVWIKNSCYYRPGFTVKISDGKTCDYAIIMQVQGKRLVLDTKVKHVYTKDEATIEVLEPHPVNVNSASPEVLFCLLKGLQSGPNWIDSLEANFITNAIVKWRNKNGALQGLVDLQELLKNLQKDLRAGGIKDRLGCDALNNGEIDVILSAARSICNSRRRFSGIITKQYYDHYRVVSPPLASMVFRNQDTYTIEATCVINNDSAVPMSRETMRRLVTVTPTGLLDWSITSQKHFERYMSSLPSFRVITYPRFVDYFSVFPAQNPNEKNTGLSLDKVSVQRRAPQGVSGSDHYQWPKAYEGIQALSQLGPALRISQNGLQITPGAASFWFYPIDPPKNRVYLFDLGEAQWENRIRCFYDRSRGIVLQVADCTQEKGVCEIVAGKNLQQRWYHLDAAWHSTDPGGLELWIDGVAQGEFGYSYGKDDDRNKNYSFLSQRLKPETKFIALKDASQFPRNGGVVRIGAETIEYERVERNGLVVRNHYTGFETIPDFSGRAARGTQALKHPKGAGVYPFGYSDPLSSEVFPGTSLAYDVYEEGGQTSLTSAISDADSTIQVASTGKFQSSGFALIVDRFSNKFEKIRYDKGKNRLINCERGQFSTNATAFKEGYIFPISIMVDDNSEFPDTGIIQIEDEWLEYIRKVDHSYFIFNIGFSEIQEFKKTGKLNPVYRGVYGTMGAKHDFGRKVIPTFHTRYTWPGRGDRVTIIQGNDIGKKEEKIVNWVSKGFIAFVDDVSRKYEPKNGSRLLKFPSGELPVSLGPNNAWGAPLFGKGKTPLRIDELVWMRAKPRTRYFLDTSLEKGNSDVTLSHVMNLPQDGGLLKVEDEYISYRSANLQSIIEPHRGFFGRPATHAAGVPVFSVFCVPLSSLKRPINARMGAMPLSNASDFPSEGYVKCGNEIISYSKIIGNDLKMPLSEERQGVFRGAFGTLPKPHPSGSLVQFFPARYWDRVATGYDGPELAYFQAAKTAPGAYWEEIYWDAEIPNEQYMGVEVRARIDGQPGWDEEPTNHKGGLFRFSDDRENRLDVGGDTLEIRVYFPYYKDAYSSEYWKSKVKLKSLHVKYRQPTRVWESR